MENIDKIKCVLIDFEQNEKTLDEAANEILRLFVGQSEQLKAFREWWNKDNEGVCTTITHKDIDRYSKSL